MNTKPTAIFAALVTALLTPHAVLADDDIEVIEVRAQKRAQKISDVAMSISVVKGEELVRENIKDLTELGRYSSNVKITQNAAEGTAPAVNIRGIGLIDYNTSNTSPIGVYVDEVTSGSANNQIVNLFDIESIEIVKGPQGTLFGRNSTGGAFLVRTNKPTDERFVSVSAGLGNESQKLGEVIVNAPLNDHFAARAALSYKDYEYSTYNLYEESPEAGLEQLDYRLMLSGNWQDMSLLLKVYGSDWDGIVQPVGNLGIYSNPLTGDKCAPSEIGSTKCFDAFGFNVGVDDFYAVKVNNNSPHKTDNSGASIQLDWQLNNEWQLVWISAFNDLERIHAFNCDGSPARLCEGQLGVDDSASSHEVRASYNKDKVYWITGLYYTEEEIKQNNFNDILRDFRGILPATNTVTFFYDNLIEIDSTALFSQLDYQLQDNLSLTFGLRYTDETTRYDSISQLNMVLDPTNLAGVTIPYYHVSGEQADSHLSGRFAVNYYVSDNWSTYYALSNGHKSGGYYGGFISTPEQGELAAYGPEQVVANEVGSKWQSSAGDMVVNAAVFHYDYSDQQVFMNQASAVPNTPPLQLLENVASSTIYGGELDVIWYPSNQWLMQLTTGYLPEANFDYYVDPVGQELTDNRLPFTSKWNIAGRVNYVFPLSTGELTAEVNFDYQSSFYFDQNENPYAMQDSYTTWNGYLNYQANDWSLNLWAANIFDKEYSNLKFDLSGFLGMLEDFKGAGRRYGITVNYHF